MIDPSVVARVVGIETNYVNLRGSAPYLPQRIALIGQGATEATYSTTKRQVTSAFEVGSLYGFGSPLHLAAKMLFPTNGDGVGTIPVTVYPLDDATAGGVAAAGSIAITGASATKAGSFYLLIGGVRSAQFSVAIGDNPATVESSITAAIDATPDLPVLAENLSDSVALAAKWKGTTGNQIPIELVGPTDTGLTFTITRMANGATDPTVDGALAQVGDVWESIIINCLPNTTALDAFSVWNEGRWLPLSYKPAVVFTGDDALGYNANTLTTDSRKTDRTNVIIPCPGSNNMPFMWAADAAGRIARSANINPASDFGGIKLPTILPGTDAEQWTYTQRDLNVKQGRSTIEVRDGVVTLSDIVTCYHPSGDPLPAYRYVCDIVKLQQVIYNLSLIFNSPEWQGAPLIPDNQPTVNPRARQPKAAVAAVCAMIDSLALDAILSDPATAKKATAAGINSTNPKRLDVATTVQLSGNTNIISVDLNFGFYFGGA